MTRFPAIELAVQDPAGVRVAAEIGAVRVELAQALALGGLTPSAATLDLALAAAEAGGLEVHVLIRPRAGGFHYDEDALAICERDIRHAVVAGAHGVVIGALTADGRLDREAMARLQTAADGACVTLHRAIDVTPDPVETLEVARALGIRRVLTSGGASAAVDGMGTLRRLVAASRGEIEIMAGSGVSAANAVAIAAAGVDALHFSAKRIVREEGGVRMGSASDGVGRYEVTDRDAALEVVRVLQGDGGSEPPSTPPGPGL